MFQNVTICGRLGRDPELRTTQGGRDVAQMSVAVESYKKVDDEWETVTTWFRCVLWEKNATRAESQLKKGSMVLCNGAIATRKYKDEKGVERDVWELVVQTFRVLDPKDKDGERDQPRSRERDDDRRSRDDRGSNRRDRSSDSDWGDPKSDAPKGGKERSRRDEPDDDIPF